MIRQKSSLVILTAGLVLLLAAPEAFAAVRTWVSPSGFDTNPCTLQAPCRNFAAAITAVDPGGEVVALSSAGYGAVVVTKSVAIISPEGVHAAIAPTSGLAIDINALDTDTVVVRNLYLNSQGADVGVEVANGGTVYIENCVVAGFIIAGVFWDSNSPSARLFVSDSTFRQNDNGLVLSAPTGKASIDSVRVVGSAGQGLRHTAEPSTVRRSHFADSGSTNLLVQGGAKLFVEDTTSTGAGLYAILAGTGVISLSRCTITSSGTGIRAANLGSVVYVSDSTIAGNVLGLDTVSQGEILTRENNTLQENTTNGAFSDTFSAN